MGGVLFSTLLTLYVVPAVYVIFDGLRGRVRRPVAGPRTARSPRRRPSDPRPAAAAAGVRRAGPAGGPRAARHPDQAIARAVRLDPDYVRALGQVDNAEWGRRAALAVFVLPSLTASIDATKYSTEFFNIGTGRNQAEAVNATFSASYELFSVRKFTDLGRSRAELESAQASELEQRFRTALLHRGRLLRRAPEPGAVPGRRRPHPPGGGGPGDRPRAGGLGRGGADDSLQLVLELTQARTDQLRRRRRAPVSPASAGPPDRRGGPGGCRAGGHGAARPTLPIGRGRRGAARP